MSLSANGCGLLAALLLAQDRVPLAPVRPETTVLTGRILTPDSTPLANARVHLRPLLTSIFRDLPFGPSAFSPPLLRLPVPTTTTSPDGTFSFPDVDPRSPAVLTVETAAGLEQAHPLRSRDFHAGASLEEWHLSATSTLTGVVVDAATNSPIPGATIRARQGFPGSFGVDPESLLASGALLYTGEDGATVWTTPRWLAELLRQGAVLDDDRPATTAHTLADGTFQVPYVPGDFEALALRVQAPGYAQVAEEIDLPLKDPPKTAGPIRLARTIATRVRVLDEKRQPLAGAIVRFGCAPERSSTAKAAGETDDESGAGTRKESKTAAASKSTDKSGHAVPDLLSDFAVSPLLLSLERKTDDQGEIDAQLPPAAPAWIAVRAPDRSDWFIARIPDRGGRFEFVLPAPMSFEVSLQSEDKAPVEGEVACASFPPVGPCSGLDAMLPLFAPDVLPPGNVPARSGSARLQGLAGGQHWIFARAPGHAISGATVVPVLPNEKITLRLHPLRQRSIRVLERTSVTADAAAVPDAAKGVGGGATAGYVEHPLAGARVEWESTLREKEGVLPRTGRAVTDGEGRFEVLACAGSTLQVFVAHADFAQRLFKVADSEKEATLVLGSGGNLAGKIHRSGKPLGAPYRIALRRDDDAPSSDLSLGALAAPPDSRFFVRGLEPGSYRLLAAKEGDAPLDPAEALHPSVHREIVIEEGRTTEIDIDLAVRDASPDPEFARVRGSVRRTGTDVPLEAWLDGPTGAKKEDRHRHVAVDREGDFDFGPVPPGKYTLDVRFDIEGKGYADLAEREIDVAPRSEPRFDFRLEVGGPVHGVVVSRAGPNGAERPVADASVRICSMTGDDPADLESWRFGDTLTTGEDGTFSWKAVPAGKHWLRVFAKDFVWHYARVEIAPGAALDLGAIVLDAGPLVAGRVVDSASGTPRCLRFDFVSPPIDRPPRFWLTFDAAHALSDATTGAFATRELAPGRYVVHLEKQGGDDLAFRPLEIEVPSGGLPALELRFEPE